jgi:hypothetical protein
MTVFLRRSTWAQNRKLIPEDEFPGKIRVYAYDSPETFYSGLADPGSIIFASGWDMDLFAQPRTLDEIREGDPNALSRQAARAIAG